MTASNQKKRNINITPFAFTEHGVTMLASVLKSEKAIQMNIAIVEAFISLKELAISYKDIAYKIEELENNYDKKSRVRSPESPKKQSNTKSFKS